MSSACLITGATGFVGSHLAEACTTQGLAVHAIARPSSDTQLLEKQGATIHRGDLTDPSLIQKAVQGVDCVIHCAAKVGDWGPVEEYRAVNVEGLRNLLEACRDKNLHRFVHLSSLGVYPARHHYGTDESELLPLEHMDGYTQTKIEAERLALQYHRDQGLPVVVLRPGFIYGPRDRTLFPNLIENLRRRRVRYIGGGKAALNTIYIGNLLQAIFLTLEKPQAIGQIYNLTDGELVSKRRFIESIANGLNLPKPPPISVPLWLARILASWLEKRARRQGAAKAPVLTQARLKFLGLNLHFSIEKAQRELGYRPPYHFEQAIEETLAWYRTHAAI